MASLLINHSTIWDPPLAHFQKCTIRGYDDVIASTETHERHVHPSETLTQLRCTPARVALKAGTNPILNFLARLPKAALACAGAAAAAGAIPVVRDALRILNIEIPQPLSSPVAFVGHLYIFTCVCRFVEDALLRQPALRDTAIRRDYLAFYDWFAQCTGMIVPRDSRGVPYTTLIWTFLRNLGSDRMSATVIRRGPTWWQVIFPNFLHVDPIHTAFSAYSVWQFADLHIRWQVCGLAMIVCSGTLINRISWAKARRTVSRLPIIDQNPPAIYKSLKDLDYRRSEAWSSLKARLRRGQLRGAWASMKQFVRMSCRYSWLHDLNPGTGASGGLCFLRGFLLSLVPPGARTDLVDGILYSTAMDLSQGSVTQTLNVTIAIAMVRRWQNAAIADFPSLWWALQPTYWQAFVTVNVLRVAQWALASSPGVGHVAHLVGATLGYSCGLMLRMAVMYRRQQSLPAAL